MATVDNYGNECADLRAEVEQLRVRLVLAEGAAAQNARERDNWKQRAEKAEALRAQLAETERNLMRANARLMRANARLMQWESGETERVGAHALKADLQKRLAAAEQRAEKAEAALDDMQGWYLWAQDAEVLLRQVRAKCGGPETLFREIKTHLAALRGGEAQS